MLVWCGQLQHATTSKGETWHLAKRHQSGNLTLTGELLLVLRNLRVHLQSAVDRGQTKHWHEFGGMRHGSDSEVCWSHIYILYNMYIAPNTPPC